MRRKISKQVYKRILISGLAALVTLMAVLHAPPNLAKSETSSGLEAKRSEPQSGLSGMSLIPEGQFTPLFGNKTLRAGERAKSISVNVKGFYLDKLPVTKLDYSRFIIANPKWARGNASPLFTDASYLRDWESPTTPGGELSAPVTNISWFAAKAYCKAHGKRLPTVYEWEYVALASDKSPDGRNEPDYMRELLEWYSRPTAIVLSPVGSGFKNLWGVYDIHGLVWEWVLDFNTSLVTGESRGDDSLERSFFCGAGSEGISDADKINYPAFMRYAMRSSLKGTFSVQNLGFRCAKDMETK